MPLFIRLGLTTVLGLSLLGCSDRDDPATSRSSRAPAGIAQAGPNQDRSEQPVGPVVLIAADGLDLEILATLIADGKLATFAQLLREGAHGVLLSEREIRSPALWTTIATGRPRQVHGIYDFVTSSRLWPAASRTEEPHLATSTMRKVPALWNLASAAKKEVAVIGWLNTWPAEEVRGLMVSPVVALGSRKQITIKGGVYPDEPDQVWPESRWPEIKKLITTPEDIDDELLARFLGEGIEQLASRLPIIHRYISGLRWSLAHSLTMREIALNNMEQNHPDLTLVFFEGADSLGHRFWAFRQSERIIRRRLAKAGLDTRFARELQQTLGGVIESYYVLLDEIVAELISKVPDGRVLIVSDHGFGDRSGRYPLSSKVPFTGEHRIEGTVIAAGKGIEAGRTIYGATLYDVAPTIADWLTLPLPGAEGHSIDSQLRSREDRPSPGAPAKERQDDKAFRAQEVERLRSLGYVQ